MNYENYIKILPLNFELPRSYARIVINFFEFSMNTNKVVKEEN